MQNSYWPPRDEKYRKDSERMQTVLRVYNIQPPQFASLTGMDVDTLYLILHSRAPLTPGVVRRIHPYVPMLDFGWLLTGELSTQPDRDGTTETTDK